MTNQDSLDEIKQLLLTYPGMESVVAYNLPDEHEVWIRFRCSDVLSIGAIATQSYWANVVITVGDPSAVLCGEPDGVSALPCDVRVPDTESDSPTHSERFGVYISVSLFRRGLLSKEKLKSLHKRWNTKLTEFEELY